MALFKNAEIFYLTEQGVLLWKSELQLELDFGF